MSGPELITLGFRLNIAESELIVIEFIVTIH